MVASERAKAIQHERSEKNLQMNKSSIDYLNAQQNTALASLTRELLEAKDDLEKLRNDNNALAGKCKELASGE